MKDLREMSYILGIKFWQDRKNTMLGLSQAIYIDMIFFKFSMQDSKKESLSFGHGVPLSEE